MNQTAIAPWQAECHTFAASQGPAPAAGAATAAKACSRRAGAAQPCFRGGVVSRLRGKLRIGPESMPPRGLSLRLPRGVADFSSAPRLAERLLLRAKLRRPRPSTASFEQGRRRRQIGFGAGDFFAIRFEI